MILLTGSTGKLGSQLLAMHPIIIGTKFDITKEIPKWVAEAGALDLIIHAAAHTYVGEAENDAKNVFKVNVYGTYNVMTAYKDVPLVYISSEYAHKPLGTYALSKYLGEEIVKRHPHHLIIRTLFKPRPWPFDVAYINQWTKGDYTDVIAKLIWEKIQSWDKKTSELCHIGTERKTMYQLAKETKYNVVPNYVTSPIIPLDYL